MYQQVYDKRSLLLKGQEAAVDAELIKQFDERALIFADGAFPEVEVRHCDVKDISNSPFGVSGFWLKAMCANNHVSHSVHEKDRPILGYLQDITMVQHEHDFGFDLTFHFEKNSYFEETQLVKQFFMKHQHSVDKAIGQSISWTAGSDVTKTKKKKGKGKKKVNVTVKCESFFNFFETVEASKDKKPMGPMGDDSEEEEDPEAQQLEDDLDLGTTIRDDLVPLALEYYLGCVEQNEGDDDEDDMDDDDENDDSDDDKPKPKKAAPKKESGSSAGGAGAADAEGQPGKEQECK